MIQYRFKMIYTIADTFIQDKDLARDIAQAEYSAFKDSLYVTSQGFKNHATVMLISLNTAGIEAGRRYLLSIWNIDMLSTRYTFLLRPGQENKISKRSVMTLSVLKSSEL